MYLQFDEIIHVVFQAAEHVLGSVLCAPGCFSVYRVSAVRDILATYASGVDEAYEFLTKDMGEDRWFCTLLVSLFSKNFLHTTNCTLPKFSRR